jgi:exodeoxyribonuclease VII large subunit
VRRAGLRRVQLLQSRVDGTEAYLEARSPRRVLQQSAERVDWLESGLRTALGHRMEALERELATAAGDLEARSPLRVLARGYALLSDEETGRLVRAPDDAAPGQRLRARLARGEITVRVEP